MAAGSDQRPATADGSWVAWTLAGIAAIWVAVTLISLLSPDMVTGSEQQHLPAAARTTPSSLARAALAVPRWQTRLA